jgi:hypothetical protein
LLAASTHLTLQRFGKRSLSFGLGLTEAGDPVAVFPLAALLEQFRALKALEYIPFAAQSGSRAKTTML